MCLTTLSPDGSSSSFSVLTPKSHSMTSVVTVFVAVTKGCCSSKKRSYTFLDEECQVSRRACRTENIVWLFLEIQSVIHISDKWGSRGMHLVRFFRLGSFSRQNARTLSWGFRKGDCLVQSWILEFSEAYSFDFLFTYWCGGCRVPAWFPGAVQCA